MEVARPTDKNTYAGLIFPEFTRILDSPSAPATMAVTSEKPMPALKPFTTTTLINKAFQLLEGVGSIFAFAGVHLMPVLDD